MAAPTKCRRIFLLRQSWGFEAMNFDFAEEQNLLRDSITRLLKDRYSFEVRRKIAGTELGWDRTLWQTFAEQGLLAIGIGEDHGGYGGGVEAMIVGEALGAALSAEPYLASIIMGAAALEAGGRHAQALLPGVVSGATLLACALNEFSAQRVEDGYRLSGAARAVVNGDCADYFILAAQSEEGPIVAVVEANTVQRRCFRTFDGFRAAEVEAKDLYVADAALIAAGADGEGLIETLEHRAIAYIAAETSGLIAMLLDATVEHLKTRQQFGQPLSRFQALQHRAVEMLVSLEQVRSMAIYAAASLEEPDAVERRRAFAAVKAVTSNAARFCGQQAVQLHGGVGLTEEHRVGWGLRRLTMIDLAFGDSDANAAKLAALGGFTAPA